MRGARFKRSHIAVIDSDCGECVGKGWITSFRYPPLTNTPEGNQYILHMNGI